MRKVVWGVATIWMLSGSYFHSLPASRSVVPLKLDEMIPAQIGPGETLELETQPLSAGQFYSVAFFLDAPSRLTTAADVAERRIASPITFNVDQSQIYSPPPRLLFGFGQAGDSETAQRITKKLYWGDPGIYFVYRAPASGLATIRLEAPASVATQPIPYHIQILRLNLSAHDETFLSAEPSHDWKTASALTLGQPLFGTSDEIEYLYNTEEGRNGWHWFTFEYKDTKPKLVFFELDILDLDVPCTMKLYRLEKTMVGKDMIDKLIEYREGIDPTEIRHDDQDDNLLAYKFITRVLRPGQYFLKVKANHPRYTIGTVLFDVPPYQDPRQAIQVAMRYMVDIGDSFFSNTPRKGASRTRAENVTDEIERCVTCHPAHFTMLSTLTAAQNGYPIQNKPQFKFLMDKLYNAMAPFYGHEGAHWLRFELAPANGISRLGDMLILYENHVSRRRTEHPAKTAAYLRLVYGLRKTLPRVDKEHWVEKFQRTRTPNFEFDGNRPISDFRIVTDTWIIFDELYRRSGDLSHKQLGDHLKSLLTSAPVNDLEDIVEQTKGLLLTGDPGLKELITRNIEEILARQHQDGGWVTAEYMSNEQFFDPLERAPFEKKSDPSLQFMTGQVLYTLQQAGFDMQDPRLQKAIRWLLPQQREFGGWLDNRGELFLMPHLETKWAVMGLSAIYPNTEKNAHEEIPAPFDGIPDPAAVRELPLIRTMDWLENLWYRDDAALLQKVLPLLESTQPLLRQAAAAALGRMAVDTTHPQRFEPAVASLVRTLGDPVKMVSRAAGWSLRQLVNSGVGIPAVLEALDSPDDYTRRGATRVFYQYFYHVTERDEVAERLIQKLDDPDMLVRIQALKSLWRWWYRTTNFELRNRIGEAFIRRAGVAAESPLVRLNVAQAIHNILDDNTVQFHKNWLRSIALQEDRDKAETARQELVEKPLARLLSEALDSGNVNAQETLLTAFNYFFLRGGIGNDYDFITFYNQEAANQLANSFLKLMRSPDAAIRTKAVQAAVMARYSYNQELLLAMFEELRGADPALREKVRQALTKFPAGKKRAAY